MMISKMKITHSISFKNLLLMCSWSNNENHYTCDVIQSWINYIHILVYDDYTYLLLVSIQVHNKASAQKTSNFDTKENNHRNDKYKWVKMDGNLFDVNCDKIVLNTKKHK